MKRVSIFLCSAAAALSSCSMSTERFQEKYTMVGSKSQFTHIDVGGENYKVHYREEGSGPTLVLLHGICDSLHTWDQWVALLQDDFRIVRLDYPPFGLSSSFQSDRDKEELWMEFLEAFYEDRGIESAYLAGNSLGGGFAWRFAAQHPERVRKLVLLDPASFIIGKDDLPFIIRAANHPVGEAIYTRASPKLAWRLGIRELYLGEDHKKKRFPDRETKRSYRYQMNRFYDLSRLGNHQKRRDSYVELFQFSVEEAESATQAEIENEIRKIQAPILLQWGSLDPWFPMKSNVPKWEAALSERQLDVKIYEAGHMPQLQKAEESAADARAFLLGL